MIDKTPYTPQMREVLGLSKAESGRMGHDHIGPEHYLLAILRKRSGLAFQTILRLGLDPHGIRSELEGLIEMGKGPTVGLFSPNPEAKLVLETSRTIAAEMGHPWVGTEHLLLSLIKTGGAVSNSLTGMGLDYDKTRKAILDSIEKENAPRKDWVSVPPPLRQYEYKSIIQHHWNMLSEDLDKKMNVLALDGYEPFMISENHILLILMRRPRVDA